MKSLKDLQNSLQLMLKKCVEIEIVKPDKTVLNNLNHQLPNSQAKPVNIFPVKFFPLDSLKKAPTDASKVELRKDPDFSKQLDDLSM